MVKVLDIISLIPLKVVSGPAHKVLNSQSLTLLDCPLIEKAVNFKRLVFVSITFHKNRGGLLWARVLERVFGRVWS